MLFPLSASDSDQGARPDLIRALAILVSAAKVETVNRGRQANGFGGHPEVTSAALVTSFPFLVACCSMEHKSATFYVG